MKPRSELVADLKEAQRLLNTAICIASGNPTGHKMRLEPYEEVVTQALLDKTQELIRST